MDFSSKDGLRIMHEVAQETAERVVDGFRSEMKIEISSLKEDMIDIMPRVVHEAMSNLGQDVSDKQEAQKDYHYLRKRRIRSERIEEWKIKGIVTASASTLIAAIIAYFKSGASN